MGCSMKRHIRTLSIGLLCFMGCHAPEIHQNTASKSSSKSSWTGENRSSSPSSKQTADMKLTLGRALERQGDVDKAMNAYREAIELDRNRPDAYLCIAILQDKQGKFRESENSYRKALKADPGNPDIYCDRGYSLYIQRRWADAEMHLQQAIALKPDHSRAHNNLGLVMAHTGRMEPALVEFRKGGCDEARAHANLAFCLLMTSQLDEARKQYQLALTADPTLRPAQTGLHQVETLLAKITPAESTPLNITPAESTAPQHDGKAAQVITQAAAEIPSARSDS